MPHSLRHAVLAPATLGFALSILVAGVAASRARPVPRLARGTVDDAASATTLAPRRAGLPLADRLQVERAIAAELPVYAPRVASNGDYALRTPRGAEVVVSDRGGVVSVGPYRATISASAIGRRTTMHPVGRGSVRAEGAEVSVVRGGDVREWWRALPSGIEHGVTLAERPAGRGELVVEIGFGDELAPVASRGDLELRARDGSVAGRYADLLVLDANGQALAARFAVEGGRARVLVDDEAAAYPIVIDPMVYAEVQKLDCPIQFDSASFGTPLGVSGDGTRLVVGSDLGAWVYTRQGHGSWALEQRIQPPPYGTYPNDPRAIAIDDTGTRLALGGYKNVPNAGNTITIGATYVYLRTGTTWALEATLTGPDLNALVDAGTSVAVDADATRLVMGARKMDTPSVNSAGGAYVFLRTGTTWAIEARIYTNDPQASSFVGESAAMSSDGSRLVLGAPEYNDGSGRGAAYVFARSGSSWSQEGKLVDAALATNATLGGEVDISADGTVVVAGAVGETGGGAAVVFRFGASWALSRELRATGSVTGDGVGSSVAIASDASRIFLGAPLDQTVFPTAMIRHGSAHVFDASGLNWVWVEKLVPSDPSEGARFGYSLAIDTSAARLVIGAPSFSTPADGYVGAAYSFPRALSVGESCGANPDCSSGYCVDGVCCSTDCGGGTALDCLACSGALTGGADGTCATYDPSTASATICRPAAGPCDLAERCVAGLAACPGDGFAAASVVCDPTTCMAGVITIQAKCTGSTASCPARTTMNSCVPFACSAPNTCRTTCTMDSHCANGSLYCDAGACVAKRGVGESCTVGNQCATGFCPAGMCTSTADAGFDSGIDPNGRARGGCAVTSDVRMEGSLAWSCALGVACLLVVRRRTARATRCR